MKHDRLYDIQWKAIREVSFSYIDRVDKLGVKSPQQVVGGIGVLFLLVCERFRLDPRRVLETSDRILRRARDVEPAVPRAIAGFLRNELVDYDDD